MKFIQKIIRNTLILFVFLCFSYSSKSQVLISLIFGEALNSGKIEFGLDGGVNWSGLSGSSQTSSLRTFNLGFYFDIKIDEDPTWMVNTGVIVKSTMGAEGLSTYSLNDPKLDSMFLGGSVNRELSYFNVPITMKYTFPNRIYLKAGVQLGLFYNAYDNFVKTIKDDDDLSYKIQVREKFHLIDAGLAFGAGYRLLSGNGINLGVQYYHGLIDMEADDTNKPVYNSSFYVTVGIPIGKDSSEN
jgi:hypothetical protein